MYYGFAGEIIFVDLTSQSIWKEALDLDKAYKFLGGFGFSYSTAYNLVTPGTSPFSGDNPLVFFAGTLAGTMVPGAVKVSAVTKLPLTNTFGWSHGSMRFASMLKWAGYDGLIVTGRANKPVCIKIINDKIEICDAADIWGKDTIESTTELKKNNREASVICIGQAGEKLVKFGLAMIDNLSTLGQGGLGAVMGSKKLKAILVYGTRGVRVRDRKRFWDAITGLKKRFMNYPNRESVLELGMMLGWKSLVGPLFCTEHMTREEISNIYGTEKYKEIKVKNIGCPGCFVADKEILEIRDEKFQTLTIPATSYTEIPALGTPFGVKNLYECGYLYHLCNRYGISSQTLVGFVNFVIDLYHNGIITQEDCDGIEIKRDFKTLRTLIDMIVHRRGIGDTFADGWEATTNRFGKDCEKYAYINKNSNFIWDPRLYVLGTMEFGQIIGPKGPYSAFGGSPTTIPGLDIEAFRRHCSRVGATDGQISRIFNSPLGLNVGRLTSCFENWVTLLSCLGICNRAANDRYFSVALCAEIYSAATGIEVNPDELIKAAERSWTISRAINVREGFTRKDDVIPERWFRPLKTLGGEEHFLMDYFKKKILSRDDVVHLLDDYYEERGWDAERGIPKSEKLVELGLTNMINDMENCSDGFQSRQGKM